MGRGEDGCHTHNVFSMYLVEQYTKCFESLASFVCPVHCTKKNKKKNSAHTVPTKHGDWVLASFPKLTIKCDDD